eukprot:GHRR01009892.1.p1 GENE.GHRR01009892.1~~GHRR01009892.1.p1  ORF type:complete len:158 (+),score=8.12 GHRR01009892.1:174-647(+)
MTLMACVSPDLAAVSKPCATLSAVKGKRCVMRGVTSTLLLAKSCMHSGYVLAYLQQGRQTVSNISVGTSFSYVANAPKVHHQQYTTISNHRKLDQAVISKYATRPCAARHAGVQLTQLKLPRASMHAHIPLLRVLLHCNVSPFVRATSINSNTSYVH